MISARAKQMSIDWLKSASILSIYVSRKVSLLAREYGGMLDNRSFGGAQASRTFDARGVTTQHISWARTRHSAASDSEVVW